MAILLFYFSVHDMGSWPKVLEQPKFELKSFERSLNLV